MDLNVDQKTWKSLGLLKTISMSKTLVSLSLIRLSPLLCARRRFHTEWTSVQRFGFSRGRKDGQYPPTPGMWAAAYSFRGKVGLSTPFFKAVCIQGRQRVNEQRSTCRMTVRPHILSPEQHRDWQQGYSRSSCIISACHIDLHMSSIIILIAVVPLKEAAPSETSMSTYCCLLLVPARQFVNCRIESVSLLGILWPEGSLEFVDGVWYRIHVVGSKGAVSNII